MSDVKHTPGPWAWFGNAGSNSVYLATQHGGRRFVMDFVRWGFKGAQPRFQPGRGVMVEAKSLLQFEVGDKSIVGIEAARKDSSVYRLDIRGIDCADARLIAAAPELLEAAADLITHWDSMSGPEKRGEFEGVGYWSPAGRMVSTEFIVALRAAIAKAEGRTP